MIKSKICTAQDGITYRKNNSEKIKKINKKRYDKRYKDPIEGPKNIAKRRTHEAEYRKNNPDIIAKSRLKNKEKADIQAAKYRKGNVKKIKAKSAQYYLDNKEDILVKCAEYRKDNKETYAAYAAQYYQDNKEAVLAKNAQWYKDNPDKLNAKTARRRAAKLQRSPAWADLEAIKQVYADCEEINIAARLAGCTEKFVVDHIIPLLGTNVSGLHIASNLQIITAKENGEKYNKFTPG